MDLKGLSQSQWDLLFAVRRSARYHDRRAGFFDTLHRITAVLTVSVAGFMFVEVSGVQLPSELRALAFMAGLFALLDFVVGYAQRADQHRHLRRQFCELEAEMVLSDQTDEKRWREHLAQRIKIEIGEPPIYRALDLLCHNELLIAEGYSLEKPEDRAHFAKLPLLQRWTRHLLRWEDIGADPRIRYSP